jgi:hypothetical protein
MRKGNPAMDGSFSQATRCGTQRNKHQPKAMGNERFAQWRRI